MIYLVVGEKSLNNLEIDKILKKEKDYSLIKYDLEENSILQVVDELNTVDIVLFPRVYEINNNINPGDIIKIRGKVEKRFDKLQIVVNELVKLD